MSRQSKPWCSERGWDYAVNQIGAAPSRQHRLLSKFAEWLRDDRGLLPSSITVRLGCVRRFVAAIAGDSAPLGRLRRLSARDIERFFVDDGTSRGAAARRSMQASLRLFLRFCAEHRWLDRELISAVPPMYVYRLSEVPRFLSDEQIVQVLESLDPDSFIGSRDLAMLLVLATYGVRRSQIATLRLSDIDWDERRIHFRAHKGGKPVVHELTARVAAAISDYVDRFRPRMRCDEVFLRSIAPHLPISPMAISGIVHARLKQAGVDAPLLSPHAFRHAFATRLLRAGRPLKVVADLLGHRALDSATVYGKVDLVALREIAAEWPEVLR